MQRWVKAARPHAWTFLLATLLGSPPAVLRAQDTVSIAETDPTVVPILQQAESLLAEKKPNEAFALLTSHELDLAGTPMFDYLLGIAALDSGKANDAAFALERVVAAHPDFAGARIELARAQYERGDLALARSQFEYLLTQSPPEA